jgi:hypothetical protein
MIECAPLWAGEEVSVGARADGADAPVGAASWGWQAGYLHNISLPESDRCLQLGFGLHFQSVDGEGQAAPLLRLGYAYDDWRSVFVQAGPSWDGERAGLDAQIGVDWGYAAVYAAYSYGDEQVITVGLRFPLVEGTLALLLLSASGALSHPFS